ncbi:MAG: hypothetical protein H8E31_14930 [Planctomycetes bacterium]|nr:hypothetical protein [Planctomycetota bacterium]
MELGAAEERVPSWLEEGGELAVQALNPVAGLPLEERRAYSLVAAGPGAAIGALAGCAIGFARISAALHPDDLEPFRRAAKDMDRSSVKAVASRLEDLPVDRACHIALMGCGGRRPQAADCLPLVRRLRPEGQLVLFGIPQEELQDTFEDFSQRGFSLRGSGIRDGLGFLAGSLDHGRRLEP